MGTIVQALHPTRIASCAGQGNSAPQTTRLLAAVCFRFPNYFNNANDEIQFCPGLALTSGGKELVLTYLWMGGQGDRRSRAFGACEASEGAGGIFMIIMVYV